MATPKTLKTLWGRAASRCSMCKMELVMSATESDDESLVGEACHIIADKVEGPRGESPLPADQRNKYENLVLLCNVHHKQVDDQVGAFPIERLHEIKAAHETWVRTQLSKKEQLPTDLEEAERTRRSQLLSRLRKLYLLSHDGISPALIARLEPLPKAWVEGQLQQLGDTWRQSEYY